MYTRKKLEGIIPAMVTPFNENEELDIEAAKSMAKWLVEKGVHGLFIVGTNGEFHLLSDDEKVELTKAVVEAVDGRVPVCAGGGCCGTKRTIELTKRLKDAGADYVSLITPYYLVPKQEDLYLHYKKVAEAVDIPLLLYNIPGQTGLKIEPETVARLSKIDNIVGIKDSGGDFDVQLEYIKVTEKEDFDVLNGSDSLMLKAFRAGSVASVAATANVLPEIEVDLYDYFKNNEQEKCDEQIEKINLLRMTLKKCVAPSVMKKTLNEMGIYAGITRGPISSPNEDVVKDIVSMIETYGIKEVAQSI